MSATSETGIDPRWIGETPPIQALPVRGSHAWVGILLVLGSSAVTLRCLCWVAGQAARLIG